MSSNQETAVATHPGIWADPWYELRELTDQHNQVLAVADRYSRIYNLLLKQERELTTLKARQETLDGIHWSMDFVKSKADELWPVVAKLQKQMEQMTERLNNDKA